MPSQARRRLQNYGATLIPASEIAREPGEPQSAPMLFYWEHFQVSLPFDTALWEEVIRAKVPPNQVKYINIEAFRQGAAYARGEL